MLHSVLDRIDELVATGTTNQDDIEANLCEYLAESEIRVEGQVGPACDLSRLVIPVKMGGLEKYAMKPLSVMLHRWPTRSFLPQNGRLRGLGWPSW